MHILIKIKLFKKPNMVTEGRNTMVDKVIENNRVSIIGEITSEFRYSHQVFGEGFYTVDVAVNRLSDMTDTIPLLVSERLVDVTQSYIGHLVEASGQFRSYNKHDGTRNKLVLSIFVRDWQLVDENEESGKTNQIFLDGFICKLPVYRKTPLGREISDLLIAVNRPYGKSDYIPCIAWGRNARFASSFEVGKRIQIWGRVQSRDYVKKINETDTEKHTAYEVSVSKLEYIDQ